MIDVSTKKNSDLTTKGCMALALLATAISLTLSVLTGWQLGAGLSEKLMLGGVGVLSVLSAHLLLALCNKAGKRVWVMAVFLWICCILYAAYSHATFFLLSQQKAGANRVDMLIEPPAGFAPTRSLPNMLAEQVTLQTQLLAKTQWDCVTRCGRHEISVARLTGQIAVLDAEIADYKRWLVQADKTAVIRDSVYADPVMLRLASWVGMSTQLLGFALSLLFSLILEGIACLCWFLALRSPRDRTSMPSTSQTLPSKVKPPEDMAKVAATLSDSDREIELLVEEVRSGRIKPTVDGIRRYCKCAQTKAAELRKQVAVKLAASHTITTLSS